MLGEEGRGPGCAGRIRGIRYPPTTPQPRSLPIRGPTRWRLLPVQAFVHETHILAAAVAILRFDFRTCRRLHGTSDGEWVLIGAQRWVPACSRLQVPERGVGKGRGEDFLTAPPAALSCFAWQQSNTTVPLKEGLTFRASALKVQPFHLLAWKEWGYPRSLFTNVIYSLLPYEGVSHNSLVLYFMT